MMTDNGIREGIEAANREFMAAFDSGDAAGVAALYTENGQILPPNSDPITGKDGIKGFWQGAMDMGLKTASLETVEVEQQGDRAMEIGNYKIFVDGGQMVDHGNYLIIWKQEDGQWRLYRDIWNTSMPAQQ